jgi:hypothetical protein
MFLDALYVLEKLSKKATKKREKGWSCYAARPTPLQVPILGRKRLLTCVIVSTKRLNHYHQHHYATSNLPTNHITAATAMLAYGTVNM